MGGGRDALPRPRPPPFAATGPRCPPLAGFPALRGARGGTDKEGWPTMPARREPERSDPPVHDLRRYADDPLGFAEQVLGVTPWQRQREALQALVHQPRVTIRSSHGVGKTWLASAAL